MRSIAQTSKKNGFRLKYNQLRSLFNKSYHLLIYVNLFKERQKEKCETDHILRKIKNPLR